MKSVSRGGGVIDEFELEIVCARNLPATDVFGNTTSCVQINYGGMVGI
jgi:hypothetical protein